MGFILRIRRPNTHHGINGKYGVRTRTQLRGYGPGVLVIWREPCGMCRLGNGTRSGQLLQRVDALAIRVESVH